MKKLIRLDLTHIKEFPKYTEIRLSAQEKSFSFFIKPDVGVLLTQIQRGIRKARPQTPEFLSQLFGGFFIEPLHLVFEKENEGIYYTKLLLRQRGVDKETLVELDARPSDALLICLQHQKPLFAEASFFDRITQGNC